MHRSTKARRETDSPEPISCGRSAYVRGKRQIIVCDAVWVSQGLILPTVVRRVSLRAVNHMQEKHADQRARLGIGVGLQSPNLRLERDNNHGEPRTTSHSDLRPKACKQRPLSWRS